MPKPVQAGALDSRKRTSTIWNIIVIIIKRLKWPIILSVFLFLAAPHYANYVNKEKNEALIKELEDKINKKVQEPYASLDIDENIKKEMRQLMNSSSHYQRGLSETLLGNPEIAEHEFSMAINQQTPVLSKYYLQRGNARLLSDKYADAMKDYNNATNLDPNYVAAWNNKGFALYGLGRYEDALIAYDKAIELDPDWAGYWSNKAAALNYLGRYEEALNASNKAIKLDPNDAVGWSFKGYTLKRIPKNLI